MFVWSIESGRSVKSIKSGRSVKSIKSVRSIKSGKSDLTTCQLDDLTDLTT